MLCDSGKFNLLDDLLPQMKDNGDRVLIFTQFVMVMDIMEQYLRIRGHRSVYNFNSKLPLSRKTLEKIYREKKEIIHLSTKKRASRASALRADIGRGIAGLLVTYPISPAHWTRP